MFVKITLATIMATAGFPALNDYVGFREKGDRYILPERPGGCFAQNVPVPLFPPRIANTHLELAAGEGLVTVRLGEQETCRVKGITTFTYDQKTQTQQVRFDLSCLPRSTEVKRAELKFWVDAAHPAVRPSWGFQIWRDDSDFDGFKVYEGSSRNDAKPVDVKFPYNIDTVWLCEFDVTRAVQRWVANPAENLGLAANFRFPHLLSGTEASPSWQLPYLEITYEGENPDRPQQVTDLKALYRSGQVFLTWQQPRRRECAYFDQAYRVYRHTRPITADNLHQAEPLGEVHRNSQLNYRRSLVALGGVYGPWDHYAKALGVIGFGERTGQDTWQRYRQAMPKRFNFVIDDEWLERHENGRWAGKVPDGFADKTADEHFARVLQGPMLGDETGLAVHTVRQEGPAYFAVTAVLAGNENRRDFSAANATRQPIAGKVETPKPVLQAVFVSNDSKWPGELGRRYVCEYVYWEGGGGRFHTEPSTPLCFTFSVPTRWVGLGPAHQEDPNFPPWIISNAQLAGYSCHYWTKQAGMIRTDTRWLPPTRIAPFPPSHIGHNMSGWKEDYRTFYYGSRPAPAEGVPTPLPDHNVRDVYGYMDSVGTGGDPRRATVRPFVEDRQLFELDFVLGVFPADKDFVVLDGESSCVHMAVHHPERFGCVDAAQEKPWTSAAGEQNAWRFSGLKGWALKNDLGHNVWEWNDPIWHAQHFPRKEWPFISLVHSDNYDAADNWKAMGYPKFLLDLAAQKRAGHWWWVDIGDAPDGEFTAVARNQAVPALSNATCCQVPLEDWRLEPRGTLNGYIDWHRPTRPFLLPLDKEAYTGQGPLEEPPGRPFPYKLRPHEKTPQAWSAVPLDLVDQPQRFAVALRIREEGRIQNGQSVPPCPVRCGRADVSPRRLQQFQVVPGREYLWKNVRVATGQLLQAGIIKPDADGLLTVPQMMIDKDFLGNKLMIEPAEGKRVPAVDPDQTVVIRYFETSGDRRQFKNMQVEELPHRDYVVRCSAPEMVPVVRPGRVFRPKDFANGPRDGAGYSMWGSAKWDDRFQFPTSGRYRIEIDTDEAYFQNGAWPILSTSVGEPLPDAYLDGDGPTTTVHWVELAEGRHRVAIRSPNNTFHEPLKHGDQDPRRDRGLTLAAARFIHLPQHPGRGSEPYLLKIEPRSAVVGAGMPLMLFADVRDAWGEKVDARVTWAASRGSTVTPDGTFTASQEGRFVVTAAAGEKSDRALITVEGNAWVERFDDQWPDGWQFISAGGDPPPLSARWWELRLSAADESQLAVYRCGMPWVDYCYQADFAVGRKNFSPASACGLVFRYRDAENCYRFEKVTGRQSDTPPTGFCRLVKIVGGKETELARTETVAATLMLEGEAWRKYPSHHIAGEGYVKPREENGRVDRFAVELGGPSITCRLNEKTVFAVRDGDLRQGTVGVFCRGGAVVDNLAVTPP